MKKSFSVFALAVFAFGMLSCQGKGDFDSYAASASDDSPVVVNVEDSFIDPGEFFTPDYTPYTPEKEAVRGKINAKMRAASGVAKNVDIPSRKLSEYTISYIDDEKKSRRFVIPQVEDTAEKTGEGTLTVSDWGPQGTINAEIRRPSFYVLFSEPMVALSAIGTEVTSASGSGSDAPAFTIEPAIAGKYVWKGTRLLSFECSENANPLTSYTIKINPAATSRAGHTISGETAFSTTASPLKIVWYRNMNGKEKADERDVAPEFEKELRVQFNYPVETSLLQTISEVTAGDKKVDFTLTQESFDTVTYHFASAFPKDTDVMLSVKSDPGAPQDGKTPSKPTRASFHTLKPFTASSEIRSQSTHGKYTNPVVITFNHLIDEKSVLKSLSIEPAMNLTADNIEVTGRRLTIFGLPVTFNTKYTVKVDSTIKDIYGQNLNKAVSYSVTVPNAQSSARFTDSGVRILESQFPHRLVFEYQNILSGAWALRTTKNPFEVSDWNEKFDIDSLEEKKEIEKGEENKRNFKTVDFDPLLKNGKGMVRFDASVELPRKPTKWDASTSYTQTNKTSVQVTDLGATVRYGVNRFDVLVSSLSTGKTIEGADVYVYSDRKLPVDEVIARAQKSDPSVLKGKSADNGLAVIPIPKETARIFFKEYWAELFVLVTKDDDMMVFHPDSHYAWRDGIVVSGASGALKTESRIFMFTDRGLYKPGETLSLRGIDRTQALGSFMAYTGPYTLTLREDTWRDAAVIGESEGVTSESGGFYGSFEIPEDAKPGMYYLEYRRKDDADSTQRIPVNIAFFERLKFQAAVTMPSAPVVSGEKIQAKVNASYLAGGSLSQASYEASWFSENWYFTSELPQFKNYRFGPLNTSENRKSIKESRGKLDAAGEASVSCATASGDIKGAPYRYRLSAEVTDSSNQMIKAASAIVVHPASFYLGLSKPEGVTSFAKKGQKLTFSYGTVLANGEAIEDAKLLAQVSQKEMTVSLSRTEWNLVQQQGVSSNVYSRYEKTEVEESKETVTLSPAGKISVTPKECGYHTIHLVTKDKKDRDVITEYSFYVTGSGSVSWYQQDATSLTLTPDQSQYNPGETAHILLESALDAGYYLITVEREGIFTEEVRYLEGNAHVIDVPVARNYVPVFYVSISSYSVRKNEAKNEYGVRDLDKPKGYYGATAVFVNPLVKSFSVSLESEKTAYRSGEEATVVLKATKGGKPLAGAELTLMAVDRGVLDLIDYHVPNPIDFYYDHYNFPLRAHGGDNREYLMDPVTYEVKNLAGGDSADEKMEQRKDFNPTAVFLPVLKTDENGEARATFKLPDTLTTYRLTAFGVKGELLALQEDEIVVQNPVNVQQIMPRRLRVRDTAEMGVLLTNLDSAAHEMQIDFAIAAPEQTALKGLVSEAGSAVVEGAESHTVTVKPFSSVCVYFEAAAKKAGNVSVVFTVKSDILNEQLVVPLTIERPVVYESVTTTGTVADGSESAKEEVIIPSWASEGEGNLSVTLDATRLGNLGQAVQYLFDYPFGCLEQQSSRVLPLLLFGDFIEVFNLHSKVTSAREVVAASLKEWASYQHADGGFGYWKESTASSWYVSARIAYICALEREKGFSEQENPVNVRKLLDYLEGEKNRFFGKKTSRYLESYITWVLSMNGRHPSAQSLREMLDSASSGDVSVLAMTGLTALQMKEDDIASLCAKKIRTMIRPTNRGVDLTDNTSSTFYNGKTENLARALELFVKLDKDDEMVSRLTFTLMENQKKGYWQNTAATASVLSAFSALIQANSLESLHQRAAAFLSDTLLCEGNFEGVAAKPSGSVLDFEGETLKDVKRDELLPLVIRKEGSGSLYYTASLKYALPQEAQKPMERGLDVSWQLFDNVTGEEISLADSHPVNLESGKIYRAVITLSSAYDRDYVALRAPIPSGAEILDATFVTSSDQAVSSSLTFSSGDFMAAGDISAFIRKSSESVWGKTEHFMSNRQIFDNEIQFFYDTFAKGMTSVEFKFRAVRKGVYPTPAVSAECMYEEEIFGRSGGNLFVIK